MNTIIRCEVMCCVGNDIWFPTLGHNVLVRINTTDFTQKVYLIPYKENKNVAYTIANYGEKLFLIPVWASKIVIFDTNTELFTSIERKAIKNDKLGTNRYLSYAMYDEKLYCMPADDEVIAISADNGDVVIDWLTDYLSENGIYGFYYCHCFSDLIFAMTAQHKGVLYVNNIKKKCEWKWDNIFDCDNYDIASYNEILYIHDVNNMRWLSFDVLTEKVLCQREAGFREHGYVHILNNKYICIDYYGLNQYEIMDLEFNIIREGKIYDGNKRFETYHRAMKELKNGNIAVMNNCKGEFQIYRNIIEKEYRSFTPSLSKKDLEELNQYLSIDEMELETDFFDLKRFLMFV